MSKENSTSKASTAQKASCFSWDPFSDQVFSEGDTCMTAGSAESFDKYAEFGLDVQGHLALLVDGGDQTTWAKTDSGLTEGKSDFRIGAKGALTITSNAELNLGSLDSGSAGRLDMTIENDADDALGFHADAPLINIAHSRIGLSNGGRFAISAPSNAGSSSGVVRVNGAEITAEDNSRFLVPGVLEIDGHLDFTAADNAQGEFGSPDSNIELFGGDATFTVSGSEKTCVVTVHLPPWENPSAPPPYPVDSLMFNFDTTLGRPSGRFIIHGVGNGFVFTAFLKYGFMAVNGVRGRGRFDRTFSNGSAIVWFVGES